MLYYVCIVLCGTNCLFYVLYRGHRREVGMVYKGCCYDSKSQAAVKDRSTSKTRHVWRINPVAEY